jgi:hypothetical protein
MTEISYVLKLFARISYFVSIYTLIQYADLDPISWSQKLPMATLGNINFMSSFLGLATCLFLSKIFCESLNLPEKVHFVFWSLLNLFLIVQSGSIQGIGILFVGLGTLVILKAFTQKNLISGFFVTGLLFLSGIVVLVGTAGRGFLGGALFQQTVTYRLDYWQAGWQMFLWNPWFGLGIDSYGDYYREYRSLEATEKTGPARVANTEHNIFLDLMSGGGFLSGFFLILLFLFPVWLGIKNFQTMRSETQFFLLFPLVIGFLFFCLISINQIGVGVWGFIFIGMCIAVSREVTKINKSTNQSNLKKSNSIGVSSEFQNKKTKVSLACFSFVMALSLVQIPVKADINFLKATKENNIAEMMKIVGSFASNSFYEERVLSYLVESNRIQEAIGLAQKLTSSDSQNFYAWSVLAFESDVPKKLRDEAALQLIRIDPQNRQLRIDLANRGR